MFQTFLIFLCSQYVFLCEILLSCFFPHFQFYLNRPEAQTPLRLAKQAEMIAAKVQIILNNVDMKRAAGLWTSFRLCKVQHVRAIHLVTKYISAQAM